MALVEHLDTKLPQCYLVSAVPAVQFNWIKHLDVDSLLIPSNIQLPQREFAHSPNYLEKNIYEPMSLTGHQHKSQKFSFTEPDFHEVSTILIILPKVIEVHESFIRVC